MNYEVFLDDILAHLSDYKIKKLGIIKNGHYITHNKKNNTFIDHGEKSHILPDENKFDNYLCTEARNALKDEDRHPCWHHLNSSQTMCVNYFSKLIIKNYEGLNIVLSNLLQRNIKISEHGFENVPVLKSTNFDFYCKDTEGHKYYFEIKYTEKDISTNGGGRNPKTTFETIYKKQIENSSYLSFCLKDNNWEMFMKKHYQAFRNIVYANEEKGDYCFFITMKDNPNTLNELHDAIDDALNNDESVSELKNVSSLFWEELIPLTIELNNNNKELVDYYLIFKDKYLLN